MNCIMSFAPHHDWESYNAAVREQLGRQESSGSQSSDTPDLESAFLRYASFYDTLQLARRELRGLSPGNVTEDSRGCWTEKLSLRHRLLAICQAME